MTTCEPKDFVMRHSMVYNEKYRADYMAYCVILDSIAHWGCAEQSMANTLRLLPENASANQKYTHRTYLTCSKEWPIPVAALSKSWACGCSLAWITGSNPTESMDVCCECYELSGRGLCVGLITPPEESYRVWCV